MRQVTIYLHEQSDDYWRFAVARLYAIGWVADVQFSNICHCK